MFFLAK